MRCNSGTKADGIVDSTQGVIFGSSYHSSNSPPQSMQPNELPCLCWTPHSLPHVLPSHFTLSFRSLVQNIRSAAAHVVPSYLLSRLLSQIVHFTTLVHMWFLCTSPYIFFPSSLFGSLCWEMIFLGGFFCFPISARLVVELTKPEVLLPAADNGPFQRLRKLLPDSLVNLPHRLLVTLHLLLSCCPSTHIVRL